MLSWEDESVTEELSMCSISVIPPSLSESVKWIRLVGRLANLAISGNYALVIENSGWLQVFDISNPTTPKRVGGFKTAGEECVEFSAIAVSGKYAYVTGGGAIWILEITEQPAITRTEKTADGLVFEWNEPAKGMKRQRATLLTQPVWEDIGKSETTTRLTVPFGDARAFFRLVKPSP